MSKQNNTQDCPQIKLKTFQDSLYNFEELKDRTNNFTDLSIKTLALFIEEKTNYQSCFVYRSSLQHLLDCFHKTNTQLENLTTENQPLITAWIRYAHPYFREVADVAE